MYIVYLMRLTQYTKAQQTEKTQYTKTQHIHQHTKMKKKKIADIKQYKKIAAQFFLFDPHMLIVLVD